MPFGEWRFNNLREQDARGACAALFVVNSPCIAINSGKLDKTRG